MIIGAAGFLVLAGGGGGAYFFLKGSDRAKEPQAAVKPATFVDLPDVLVNLSNTGTDRTQYLKVKIVLELPDQTLVPQIQPLMPRVMDAFQTYLRDCVQPILMDRPASTASRKNSRAGSTQLLHPTGSRPFSSRRSSFNNSTE